MRTLSKTPCVCGSKLIKVLDRRLDVLSYRLLAGAHIHVDSVTC